MKHTLALLTALLLAPLAALHAAEPFLVENGQPRAEIVVANAAHEGVKRAAEDLQFHLKEISGAALPVVNAPSKEIPYQLYVGENEFTKALGYSLPGFHNSGYDILVTEHYAVFAGGPSTPSVAQKNDVEVKRYTAAAATTIRAATACGSPERASNAATSAVRRMTFWVGRDVVRNGGLRCFPSAADEVCLTNP